VRIYANHQLTARLQRSVEGLSYWPGNPVPELHGPQADQVVAGLPAQPDPWGQLGCPNHATGVSWGGECTQDRGYALAPPATFPICKGTCKFPELRSGTHEPELPGRWMGLLMRKFAC
jgi:hypothetical protein